MKHILPLLSFLLLLAACQERATFHITGHIKGAADSMLVLEHLTLGQGVVAVDSVRLAADGAFTLSATDTATNPEFYRLRLADQIVNLSVDQTETLRVEANWPRMAFGYTVAGSGDCDTIRLLTLALEELREKIDRVADDRTLTLDERSLRAHDLIKAYKDDIKAHFIADRYDRPSSYYALFQTLSGAFLFDLDGDESDVRWASAVANAWATRYPHAPRTKNLENIVLQGRRNTRRPHVLTLDTKSDKVQETGIIDMGFRDIQGRERRLSDLKGQVVLLEFTAYGAKGVADHNIALRELYAKYHNRGLEIYQVSIDADAHLWKTVADNLPWICVYDEEGTQSDMLTLYQVGALPSYYLIDRQGDLTSRMENIPDLEAAVASLL